MTKVRYSREGDRHVFTMAGHAGYGGPGQPDIVCAACSAIGYALVGALENQAGVEDLRTEERPGFLGVACRCGAVAGGFFFLAIIGLQQVAQAYPRHVAVTTEHGEE